MLAPDVGTTALFTFTTPFAKLNGIYTLQATTLYETAVAQGIDFVNGLYVPAGLTENDYNNDWKTYAGQTVLTLQSVTTPATVIYPLEPLLALIPDPTVKNYPNLYVAIMLGCYADQTKLQWLVDEINNIAQSVTGTTNSAKLLFNSSKWLTQAEYAAIDTARQANVKATQPLYEALQAQIAENNRLKTLVSAYEATLIELYKTP